MPCWKDYQRVAWIAIIIALAIVAHHFIFWGRFLDWGDILHHEWIWGILLAFAVGVLYAIPKGFRRPPKRI